MNALLTVRLKKDSDISALLENVLLEEFPDGFSIHADGGIAIIIRNSDCDKQKHNENIDSFELKNGDSIIIDWSEYDYVS